MRIIKDNIGFVQNGIRNFPQAATFPDEFTKYLSFVFNEIVESDKSIPLVLIIHEFSIGEITKAMSEEALFNYELEFARKIDDQLHSVYYAEGVLSNKGLDVTNKHGSRMLFKMIRILHDLNKSDWKEEEGELIELDTLKEFDNISIAPKGVYANFVQLSLKDPFITSFNLERTKDKDLIYRLTDSDGKRIKRRISFVSDESSIYIKIGAVPRNTFFLKAIDTGKYTYFEIKFSDLWAADMFGIVGLAFSYSKKAIVLEMESGIMIQINNAYVLDLLKDHPHLKALYLKTEGQLDDMKAAIISLNEIYRNR